MEPNLDQEIIDDMEMERFHAFLVNTFLLAVVGVFVFAVLPFDYATLVSITLIAVLYAISVTRAQAFNSLVMQRYVTVRDHLVIAELVTRTESGRADYAETSRGVTENILRKKMERPAIIHRLALSAAYIAFQAIVLLVSAIIGIKLAPTLNSAIGILGDLLKL